MHPGQCARILDRDSEAGWLGALHPELAARLGMEEDNVVLFELSLDALLDQRMPTFSELSRFPAIRRDLAVVVGEEVTASQVCEVIRKSAGEGLRELQVFDVYRGKGVENGTKSLAIGLTLQEFSRTLTDDEIESVVARVLQSLQGELGATMRE